MKKVPLTIHRPGKKPRPFFRVIQEMFNKLPPGAREGHCHTDYLKFYFMGGLPRVEKELEKLKNNE
jgi:hypothetical protein